MLDQDFQLQGTYKVRPISLGQYGHVEQVGVFHTDTACFAFSRIAGDADCRAFGNTLFCSGGTVRVDRSTGVATIWTVLQNEYVQPMLTPTHPPFLHLYGDPVLGRDQKAYSAMRTPTQASIIRWNLAALPSQTFPRPALTPIQIHTIPDQTAKIGAPLTVIIEVSGGVGRASYLATGLPTGAFVDTTLGGNASALRWAPAPYQVGVYTVVVKAQDEACQTATANVKVTVTP